MFQMAMRSLALVALLLPLAGCASLPSLEGRPESRALVAAPGTPIVDVLAPIVAEHPGLTGIYPLRTGLQAFAARVALIDAAAVSLDLQYYIWHGDLTGRLMFDAVRRAAERGVRVRMLLDDGGTSGVDPQLAALDAHPNIEVRLFNPFVQRSFRALGFLTDFSRVNRRMHNKSLTADGSITIVGGRNVGDEYFGAGEGVGFIDLDVIAGGAVVGEVETAFDAYWACESSYPLPGLLPAATPADVQQLAGLGAQLAKDPAAQRYLAAVRDTTVIRDLLARRLEVEWAPTRLLVDDPAKGLDRAPKAELLLGRLLSAFGGTAKREIVIISPYFVPGRSGVESLTGFAERGMKVRILTNSLEATDVPAVHSGYAKYRKALLQAGIELYETRRRAGLPEPTVSEAAKGSSGSSLHAKTFGVDRERLFVGSFNFDPRSAALNTELGFVIDSPTLARALFTAFDEEVPFAAYRVQFDAEGKLEWIEQRQNGPPVRYAKEPGASFGRRFAVGLLSLLPLDSML
jgi:putative cardiolipin synthase